MAFAYPERLCFYVHHLNFGIEFAIQFESELETPDLGNNKEW